MLMSNLSIKKNLNFRKNRILSVLNSNTSLDPLFRAVLNDVHRFDFATYKERLYRELLVNMEAWWINTEKGIQQEQPLDAILFEYDNFFLKDCKALAYGIWKWKDQKVQTDQFDMGSNYDFTTGFHAVPAISVNFFDSLKALEYDNLPPKFKNEVLTSNAIAAQLEKYGYIKLARAVDEYEEYYQLIKLHQYKGMIAIHEVLCTLDQEKAFETLNYNDNFMFLIGEHDTGETYPLLIKKK